MKYLATIYALIAIMAVLFSPQAVLAESSTSVTISNNGDNSQNDVNVQNSTGDNTICINGKCATSGGDGSQSTICINGQCRTSDNSNVDMQSNNGHDQVHIHTNSSTSASPMPIATDTLEPSSTDVPTVTPDPTIMQMRQDINNKVQQHTNALKAHMKEQNDALMIFFKSEMDALQNLLRDLFK